jgi:Ser/Thr protein kinase RdoA (MazF antagonist)
MQRGLSGFCQQQLPQLDAVDAGLQDNLCQRRAEYARLRDAWGGVVHGEFRPANLSIVGDAVIGILDWNRSFVETRLHDICFAAVAFSGPEELSRWHCAAQFQQFLAYYDACFPLQEEEWRLLPGYLEYMALRSTLASWRVEQFVERYAFLECLPNLIPSAVHAIGIGPEGIES